MKRMSFAVIWVAAMALAMPTGASAWLEGAGEYDEVLDLTPNVENGRDIYVICSGCHLPEGWGMEEGTFPQLAGQHKEVQVKQMVDYRDGKRDNPTMVPFALAQSIGGPQALADVVAYIASLPMSPANGKGPWEEGAAKFAQGKKLYAENCAKCHADRGEGMADNFFPRLQGQHYQYMLRQFEWIRDGERGNANPDMVEQIRKFKDADMQAVINYVSRIAVPAADLAESAEWKNPDIDWFPARTAP